MLFMVIERFKNGDPVPIYEQLEKHGRSLPNGLTYINSWVADDFTHCYQILDCDDEPTLLRWISTWTEHIDFEVVPVVTSEDARTRVFSNGED